MGTDKDTKNECMKAQEMIPAYLKGDLVMKDARFFTDHIRCCPACRDEIEISYLLEEGISRVEHGESLDLKADLDEMLEKTESAMHQLRQFKTTVTLVEATAVFVLFVCALLLFI